MQSLTVFREIDFMQLEGASEEALQMYSEIKDFIYSGIWTKSAKTKEMLPLMSEGAGAIANKLGLSKTNVLASRSQASDKLRKILGKNLSSNILSNDPVVYENFRYRMQCAIAETLSLEEILFPDVLDRIDITETDNVYDLEDCKKEIEFLSDLSVPRYFYKLGTLDKDKLSYIIGVLNKPSNYKTEDGLRVKNTVKYEVLGEILYQADKDEYQLLKEKLNSVSTELDDTKKFARNRIAELKTTIANLLKSSK